MSQGLTLRRLFLTNVFLCDDVRVNLLTLIICAVGGVAGWLVIVILHLLRVAFWSPTHRSALKQSPTKFAKQPLGNGSNFTKRL